MKNLFLINFSSLSPLAIKRSAIKGVVTEKATGLPLNTLPMSLSITPGIATMAEGEFA